MVEQIPAAFNKGNFALQIFKQVYPTAIIPKVPPASQKPGGDLKQRKRKTK